MFDVLEYEINNVQALERLQEVESDYRVRIAKLDRQIQSLQQERDSLLTEKQEVRVPLERVSRMSHSLFSHC